MPTAITVFIFRNVSNPESHSIKNILPVTVAEKVKRLERFWSDEPSWTTPGLHVGDNRSTEKKK